MKKSFSILFILLISITGSYFAQDSTSVPKEYNNIEEALKNPEKVLRLNLSNQEISFTPQLLKKFINLEYLSLENDHLSKVPEAILELQSP